jgi:hypothetical protein
MDEPRIHRLCWRDVSELSLELMVLSPADPAAVAADRDQDEEDNDAGGDG